MSEPLDAQPLGVLSFAKIKGDGTGAESFGLKLERFDVGIYVGAGDSLNLPDDAYLMVQLANTPPPTLFPLVLEINGNGPKEEPLALFGIFVLQNVGGNPVFADSDLSVAVMRPGSRPL